MNHKSILRVGGGLFLTMALCAPASAQVKPGMDLTLEAYSHEYEEEFGGTWFMTNEGFLGSMGWATRRRWMTVFSFGSRRR